jgi:hypothetical protein
MKLNRKQPFGSRYPRGTTAVEVVVATTLLVSALALVASVGTRLLQVGKHERNYRIATHELANRLEQLSVLSPDAIEESVKQLSLSEAVQNTLPNAKLQGHVVANEEGSRLVLTIDWDRGVAAKPITMVAWLAPQGGQP